MNPDLPKVSVIIPMYNVERFIEQAVLSVLDQTYPFFEIICVNDGSSDKTVYLLNGIRDPRIKLVSQLNRGLSGARNTGINCATGELIALLDADDMWTPDKLQQHVDHFNRNPGLDVSYCASEFIDANGKSMGIGQYPKLTQISAKDIFCRNPIGNGSAAVIKRSAFDKIGVKKVEGGRERVEYFNENLRQSEDIECWLRLALQANATFEGIGQAMTLYRTHEDTLSANISIQLASWRKATEMNHHISPAFFEQYHSLALAYQYRYMARRSIRDRETQQALRMCKKALLENYRILFEEPARTINTCLCALLQCLPTRVYDGIEKLALQSLKKIQVNRS